MDKKLLKLIEKNSKLSAAELATMLGRAEADVAAELKQLENDKVILGYQTVIDWDKTDAERVTALIEVKVAPRRGEGFERVAGRIYQYKEVDSLYLMSGGFDLTVVLRGHTLKEVALFVAQKLATIEGVAGTATHFILKKYKDNGVMFDVQDEKEERALLI